MPRLLRKVTSKLIPDPNSGMRKLKYCSNCQMFRKMDKTFFRPCACDEASPKTVVHSDKVQYSGGMSKEDLKHDKYYLFEVIFGPLRIWTQIVLSWTTH
jgi:hypothetical protein